MLSESNGHDDDGSGDVIKTMTLKTTTKTIINFVSILNWIKKNRF
jgi:hypothetical protein